MTKYLIMRPSLSPVLCQLDGCVLSRLEVHDVTAVRGLQVKGGDLGGLRLFLGHGELTIADPTALEVKKKVHSYGLS